MENFEEISVAQAKDLMKQKNIVIVDIRDQGAFEEGHIEHALHVDDANIDEFINNADKHKPVLCYCYMGFSSKSAAQYFKDNGFDEVYSVIGGYTDWERVNSASEDAAA